MQKKSGRGCGSGRGGGVRSVGGGGGALVGGGRAQGGCEPRIEVLVKMQKIIKSGGGVVGGGGGCVGRGESGWMWTKNWSYCENAKEKLG